jgi:hypothetical protein
MTTPAATMRAHDTKIDYAAIVKGLNDGKALADLSAEHNLSREKIRQIGEDGGVTSVLVSDYLAPAHIKLIREISTTVCRALDSDAVFTTIGLRERFHDIPPRFVDSAIKVAELTPLLGYPDPPDKAEYTVEDMHVALRAAAALVPEGEYLTGPLYDKMIKDGAITGPSRVLIIQRTGSWGTACEAAGVPYRPARRKYSGVKPEQFWHWLEVYALDMVKANEAMTFDYYGVWAKGRKAEGVPSGSLIKARMLVDTTWNRVRDQLILRTYNSMPEYWVRTDA